MRHCYNEQKAQVNPYSAVGVNSRARSKPSVAKTIPSASERWTIISTLREEVAPLKQHAKTQKDFEAAQLGVFATPDSLLARLNCKIRGQIVNTRFVGARGVRTARADFC